MRPRRFPAGIFFYLRNGAKNCGRGRRNTDDCGTRRRIFSICGNDAKTGKSEKNIGRRDPPLPDVFIYPPRWNEADYQQALKAFQIFSDELYSGNPYLLQNDIYAGRDSVCVQKALTDPVRMVREQKNAVCQAQKLISHIHSAMDLTGGLASDNAAVVAELARNIGLSLLSERIVPKSKAITICLLMVNPLQRKPNWLIEKVADILKEQLNKNDIKQLKEKI